MLLERFWFIPEGFENKSIPRPVDRTFSVHFRIFLDFTRCGATLLSDPRKVADFFVNGKSWWSFVTLLRLNSTTSVDARYRWMRNCAILHGSRISSRFLISSFFYIFVDYILLSCEGWWNRSRACVPGYAYCAQFRFKKQIFEERIEDFESFFTMNHHYRNL